jgi:hypothetical protein
VLEPAPETPDGYLLNAQYPHIQVQAQEELEMLYESIPFTK